MKKLIFIMILLCFSCKKENKEQATENKVEAQPVLKDNMLKISMDVLVLEDDTFQLYYIDESPEESYSVKKRIAKAIKGKEDFQKIEFSLPAEVLPYKFRIDVGEKGLETPIEINTVKLALNSNVIDIDNTIFDRFFQPNIYLKKAENKFVRTRVNNRCDPFFESKAFLIKKIELEL